MPRRRRKHKDAPPPTGAAAPTPGQIEPAPLLFEIGWEVCWQLGGIYTVLRSKAIQMLNIWGDRYCLIGPYNPQTAAIEFEERQPPEPLRQVLARLAERGVPARFGQWLIAGRPRVILLDFRALYPNLDQQKYLVWKDHGISLGANDAEINDVVCFGFAVAAFFQAFSELCPKVPLLAHFHEWMGGLAVPRIVHMRLPVATVFTTHATQLGRYLASNDPDLYNNLAAVNADAQAARYRILAKHQIEKSAAHAATVFTTVSQVTGLEAERLLERAPDAILPNGLNIQRFAALHEFQNLHLHWKEKIHEFVMGHFFPCYTFDLENTLYFFTSGRYEYRNKGIDLFIEAMYQLNARLKEMPEAPTIVAFIITRAAVRSVNVAVLQSQSMFDELQRTCQDVQEQIGHDLFQAVARGRFPEINRLINEDSQIKLKRALHAWRSGQPPVIVTHDLVDDVGDPILQHLRHRGLFNAGSDPVKVVFYPQFMTETSPLLPLDYEEFVRGCHMGIFPSYYEPWGYTPMECTALGVSSVSTDLSGFGAFVEAHVSNSHEKGIYVLKRRQRSFDDALNDLVNHLLEFVRLNQRQRIELRNQVERLSDMFDWSEMVRHYRQAHDLALSRIGAHHAGTLTVRLV